MPHQQRAPRPAGCPPGSGRAVAASRRQPLAHGFACLSPSLAVQNATLLVLNVCLLAFIFVGASLFALPLPPQLLPHIAFLLVLAVGLLVAVNWWVVVLWAPAGSSEG